MFRMNIQWQHRRIKLFTPAVDADISADGQTYFGTCRPNEGAVKHFQSVQILTWCGICCERQCRCALASRPFR